MDSSIAPGNSSPLSPSPPARIAKPDGAPGPEFGLKDAITLKHAYVDQTHKFWAYFQLAAAAATGFAWQSTPPSDAVLASLAAGFAIFAVANNRLVVDAQAAAFVVSEAIDQYLLQKSASGMQNGLLGIANRRKIDSPRLVRVLHVVLAMAVVLLILIRMTVNKDPSIIAMSNRVDG
jgi:hypothetical protein